MNKRKTLFFALIALAISLACELLLFNFRPLTSLGREWTPLPAPEITDDLAGGKTLTLRFYGVDRKIRQCHVAVAVYDRDGNTVGTNLVIQYTDDGHSDLYRAGSVRYTLEHDHASYFCINSYGDVHNLVFRVEAPERLCTWAFVTAEVNGSIPFHISIPRIGGFFAVLMLFWFLRPSSVLHDNRLWNRRRWVKGVCVLLLLTLNAFVCFKLTTCNDAFVHIADNWTHHRQYALLARAFAEGTTWVETPEQEQAIPLLQEMGNPYDLDQRTPLYGQNITPPWDTAFYGDHLYVYFGVVPVVLGYLPYYLITGSDLPTYLIAWVCFVLVLIGAFAFLRALIRRCFPTTSFPAYVLLSLLLGNCTGVLFYTLEPSFYIVPVCMALAFVLFALALWISAAERWEKTLGSSVDPADPETLCFVPVCAAPRAAGIGFRIALGALLAALVAGCRPQFLVFTALALPILGPFIRKESRRAVTLRRIVAFALPYIAVAIPLMYYNYIRFDSPFDFGANYNLTTNDMRLRGIKPDRLPDGLFAYLFTLPNVKLQFPYLHRVDTTPIYLGRTITEPMFGGSLVTFPFLWLIVCARRVKGLLREKKLWLFFLLPVLLAVVVIIADTEMAGILLRYTGDYLALLYLSASLVYLALLEHAAPQQRRRLRVFLTAVTVFTLAVCLLIAINASYLETRTPEAYFRLKDFLSFG